jgi:hypothetical protein
MCARLFACTTIGPCIEVKKDTKWRAGPTGSVENDPTKTLKGIGSLHWFGKRTVTTSLAWSSHSLRFSLANGIGQHN